MVASAAISTPVTTSPAPVVSTAFARTPCASAETAPRSSAPSGPERDGDELGAHLDQPLCRGARVLLSGQQLRLRPVHLQQASRRPAPRSRLARPRARPASGARARWDRRRGACRPPGRARAHGASAARSRSPSSVFDPISTRVVRGDRLLEAVLQRQQPRLDVVAVDHEVGLRLRRSRPRTRAASAGPARRRTTPCRLPPRCSRRCSQRPHGSSPTPLPSEMRAPQRAATTAAFAGAPPLCGTNASACSKPATGPFAEEVDERLAEAEHRHTRKITVADRPAMCPPLRLRAGRRTLAAAVACSAFALWNPPLRDLAAHTFRAEFFEDPVSRSGTTAGTAATTCSPTACCSRRWPRCCRRCGPPRGGGHERVAVRSHGPRALGRAARHGRACGSACSARSRCSRTGGWCSRSAPPSASAALRALQRGPARHRRCAGGGIGAREPRGGRVPRPRVRGRRARLGAAPRRWCWTRGRRRSCRWRCWGCCFPRGGQFPFWFSAWWPLALFCTLALLAIRGDEGERDVRAAAAAYLALATLAAVLPNPLGGNMTRLGSLFGGPVLLAIVLTRAPRRVTPVVVAALVRGTGVAGDHAARQTSESLGDPATERSYYQPLRQLAGGARRATASASRSRTRSTTGRRRTCRRASRSRAGGCASSTSSATALFYEGELDAREHYRRGCTKRAIRWVAASDARLDYSAQDEDAWSRAEPPYLRLRARLEHWRIYEVVRADPDAHAARDRPRRASRRSTPESFDLSVERAGRFVVRVRHTPYWDGRRRRLRGPGRRLDAGAGLDARDGSSANQIQRWGRMARRDGGRSGVLNVTLQRLSWRKLWPTR